MSNSSVLNNIYNDGADVGVLFVNIQLIIVVIIVFALLLSFVFMSGGKQTKAYIYDVQNKDAVNVVYLQYIDDNMKKHKTNIITTGEYNEGDFVDIKYKGDSVELVDTKYDRTVLLIIFLLIILPLVLFNRWLLVNYKLLAFIYAIVFLAQLFT